jgi:hypothetical protein
MMAKPYKGSKRKRAVNLPKLAEPQMITLTELPANRTGFRVIRSAHAALEAEATPDTEDEGMLEINRRQRSAGTTAKKQEKAPVKASRADAGLLTLVLPEGSTEDDAAAIMEQFGLSDDYTIRKDEETGAISLVRNHEDDAELPAGVPIALSNDLSATVDPTMFPAAIERADAGEGIKVARMDFDIAHFETLEDVRDYLTANKIDFIEDGVEQVEGGVIVHRTASEDYDGKGVKIELAPGLHAHITRADADDVPVAIRRAVTDAAFGSFGMGHLDFAAAMVDPEFSHQAGNAIVQLADVLDNIVFRATDFAGFMGGLMDAVGDMGFASREEAEEAGEEAIDREDTGEAEDAGSAEEAAQRSDEATAPEAKAEDAEATAEDSQGEETARADQEDGGEAKDAKTGGDDDGEQLPIAAITRQDVEDVVKVALEAAGATFGEALKGVAESVEKTTKRIDEIGETVKGLGEKVEEFGETTNVARSDDDDVVIDEGEPQSKDLFTGAFGKNFGRGIRRI